MRPIIKTVIAFDIETIRKMPNGSITDGELIRQIALYSIEHPNEKDVADKIDPRFAYAGLYPYIHIPPSQEDLIHLR